MQLDKFRAMSAEDCRQAYLSGKLDRFKSEFHEVATGEKDSPAYEGADMARIRHKLDISQEALGVILGFSAKAVSQWERSIRKIPKTVCNNLCCLDRLEDIYFDVIKENLPHIELLRAAVLREDRPYPAPAEKEEGPPPEVFDRDALRALRVRRNLTRKKLAALLSISLSTLSRWEKGTLRPKGIYLTVLRLLWKKGIGGLT